MRFSATDGRVGYHRETGNYNADRLGSFAYIARLSVFSFLRIEASFYEEQFISEALGYGKKSGNCYGKRQRSSRLWKRQVNVLKEYGVPYEDACIFRSQNSC